MYIYICICINIYIYNHTHTCMCIYIYIHTYTNTHMHTPAHTRERSPSGTYRYISYIYHMYAYTEYVYTHVRIRIHIHIFVYIHGYMYINTPAHTRERSPSAHIRARPLATPRQPSRTSCHLRVCVTHGGGGGGGGYSLTSTRNSTPAVTQDLSPACMGKWRRVKRALCPMLYVLFVSQTNSTASTQQSPTHYTLNSTVSAQKRPTPLKRALRTKCTARQKDLFFDFFGKKKVYTTYCIPSKESRQTEQHLLKRALRTIEIYIVYMSCAIKSAQKSPTHNFPPVRQIFFLKKTSLYNLLYILKRSKTNRTAFAQKSPAHNRA